MAWMRGAFNGQRLVVSGAGKPEAKASAVDATRANGAQRSPAPAVAALRQQ
jgi:hypothetical protein